MSKLHIVQCLSCYDGYTSLVKCNNISQSKVLHFCFFTRSLVLNSDLFGLRINFLNMLGQCAPPFIFVLRCTSVFLARWLLTSNMLQVYFIIKQKLPDVPGFYKSLGAPRRHDPLEPRCKASTRHIKVRSKFKKRE